MKPMRINQIIEHAMQTDENEKECVENTMQTRQIQNNPQKAKIITRKKQLRKKTTGTITSPPPSHQDPPQDHRQPWGLENSPGEIKNNWILLMCPLERRRRMQPCAPCFGHGRLGRNQTSTTNLTPVPCSASHCLAHVLLMRFMLSAGHADTVSS